MALTHAVSTNNYGPAHLIVATSAANGTHTTLASAMADAVAGDTIFLRDSVTENVTLTAGVNITAWTGGTLNTPTITGTLTMTTAGTCNISGIKLQTNSASLLAVTGSAASIVNLNNCYLNCTNNTGITFSVANTSASININDCTGDIGTTGIALFAHSSTANIVFSYSLFSNSGASTTANTVSAGGVNFIFSVIKNPTTTSSTGSFAALYSYFDTSAQNVIATTIGGSGSNTIDKCFISSGSASAITISQTLTIDDSIVISSNTNAITGAGTILYSGLCLPGSSTTINTTTQTRSGTIQGSKNTAPTAGYLGERITANAAAVATTNSTAKSLTNISLTAGVWDVSGISLSTATGGTALMQAAQLGISATNNTLPSGTAGIDYFQVTAVATALGCTTGPVRVVISATTIYYLVVDNFYSSTTCPTAGMITATRVG